MYMYTSIITGTIRTTNMTQSKINDLLIVGGGINGTGIACDAAGRGLSVALYEQNDLGSGTSSASTKLIHGGLRYLEYGHFGLVRKALNEREVLLSKAPHLIAPIRFIMPHVPQGRPRLLLTIGFMLYDHLGKRKILPRSKSITLKSSPLIDSLHYGFEYSDCWVDDARLVIANAQAAFSLGASINPHHCVDRLNYSNGFWTATVFDKMRKEYINVWAKAIVNATGPWISHFISHHTPIISQYQTKLVQGSHIIVKRTYEGQDAYVLQADDKRIVFVIPYENQFLLIGTTELEYQGDPADITMHPDEETYLINCYNNFFKTKISHQDIVNSYTGVRPLVSRNHKNISSLSRDYELETIEYEGLPLVNIFGGKITTYRQLAEDVMKILQPYFPHLDPPWTAQAPLPGGDIPHGDFAAFFDNMRHAYPWLSYDTCYRYARLYGTKMSIILLDAHSYEDLGQHFGADCYEAELLYLVHYEWARTCEDLLWRRTKLGLILSAGQQQDIDHWATQLFNPR